MPNELPCAPQIQSARAAVAAHPQGDLRPGYREAIYAACGPFVLDVNGADNRGYRRRAYLALLCASKVKTAVDWKALPERLQELPHYLDNAARSLVSACPVSLPDISLAWDLFEDVVAELPDRASYAIICALQAFEACRVDERFNPDGSVDYEARNSSNPSNWDAAQAASDAYALSSTDTTPLPQEHLVEARKEFWNWWLTEAIETAYRTVS